MNQNSQLLADLVQPFLKTPFSELPPQIAQEVGARLKGSAEIIDYPSVAALWDEMLSLNKLAYAIDNFDKSEARSLERAEIYARQEREKQAAGRYTLEEAAKLISDSNTGRFELILRKLMKAAQAHNLRTYLPGEQATNEYGEDEKAGQSSKVRDYYEQCYWSDINEWLAKYESRISYRFPVPENEMPIASPAVAAPNQVITIKPIQRTAAQDAAILAEIKQLGFDPLSLPKPERGKSGVKAQIRSKLTKEKKDVFISIRVFNDAWQRLRKEGKIRDK
jgi:hypothetical protein